MKTLRLYFSNLMKLVLLILKPCSLERLNTLAQHFLMALVIDLLVLSVYHHSIPHAKIVTLDITQLSKIQLKSLAAQSLSEAESLKAIQSYAQQLETFLQNIARQNHWIILPTEAVIKGAPDLTDEVQSLLNQTLE